MESEPKTRRESKKFAKDKAQTCYSAKRIRQIEAFQEKASGNTTKHSPKNK